MKNKSLISDLAQSEINPTEILRLRGCEDSEAAEVFTNRLMYLEAQGRKTYIERGLILVEVDERELFKFVTDPKTGKPYEKFTHWVMGSAPFSRSECFAAKASVLELRDVPTQDLLQMPRCNTEVLAELSSDVRKDPEIIEAAKTQSENELEDTIQKKYPSQHREPKRAMFVKPTQSAKVKIDKGLKVAAWVFGATSREDIIEAVLVDMMSNDCDVEGYQANPETGEVLSNEDAYEVAKSRGEAV